MKNLLATLCLGLMVLACNKLSPSGREENAGIAPRDVDTLPSSCPFLTEDPKGNIVLSYVREVNDSVFMMCYVVSEDKGKSFGNPIEIPSSRGVRPHGENLPKMVFKPDGEILAIWGVSNPSPTKKYGGLVFYAQSHDGGKTFSEAKPLVRDTTSIDQRYFDVAVLPDGEAGIVWLDNRRKSENNGSTLYFAVTKGNNGFQEERPLQESTCVCCRTELFVGSGGKIHVAYRIILNDSIRDMVHMVSTDGGKAFSPPQRISPDDWVINGCPHTGPTMTENQNGLHFSWFTMGKGEGVFYGRSADYGKTFSPRESVSSKPSAKHPQITAFESGNLAIVWDEASQQGDATGNHIGLQVRDPLGKVIGGKIATSDSGNFSFPVLKAIDNATLLIAYTARHGKKSKVNYQLQKWE
ncbi:MAG TPA: sialidase family protein [Fibrobacteria bacterium]|nr:sialidase family protein [Fibrobacteria bacterium]